jgi:LysR family hydrogen peroxide-inducible transcriptional activator
MELQQLRYVAAVARAGNFSRAAEECHVSQPSLSQQIQKLEEELGERLFDRLRRQARLTSAGERFLQRAVRVLDELEAAQREARESNDLAHGRVVIGVLPTIAPYFLPGVIAAFNRGYPGIEVVVQEETTARLLKLARDCDVDVAIASLPIDHGRFAVVELFREELLLAMPATHALARKRSISIADLENERFILMKEGHCLGDQVLRFCNKSDFHPRVSCRSAQIETVQALVRTGLGISLIPAMAKQTKGAHAPLYRSLKRPRPERTLVALWPRQRQPGRAAAAFLVHARAG